MISKVLWLFVSGSLLAAGGAYLDVQDLKTGMEYVYPTVKRNNNLLCSMALKMGMEPKETEEFCLRSEK